LLNDKPGNAMQAGHAESTSEPGCWLKAVRSEDSLCC